MVPSIHINSRASTPLLWILVVAEVLSDVQEPCRVRSGVVVALGAEMYRDVLRCQERAWYDAHREQILRGDDGPGEEPAQPHPSVLTVLTIVTMGLDGSGLGL